MKKQLRNPAIERLTIESLDQSAQGVAHHANGSVVFVRDALPQEVVDAAIVQNRKQWSKAETIAWHRQSAYRVNPRCSYFGVCGGCSMQHLHAPAQVAVKQRALEDVLWHIGRVRAKQVKTPIQGANYGYRHRGRLSVRYVEKKGTVLVGFRERGSALVADMQSCEIVPQACSHLLPKLRELIGQLSVKKSIAQIEFCIAEPRTSLVLRHLAPLTQTDKTLLTTFARQHAIHWWLQSGGVDTIVPLYPDAAELYYTLNDFALRFDYLPNDFTQVNTGMNRVLVRLAVQELALKGHERVMDWFCGIGNFTLAITAHMGAKMRAMQRSKTQAPQVIGVEGSQVLVERAEHNAKLNSMSQDQVQFIVMDLFTIASTHLVNAVWGHAQCWLLDPPREGAIALCQALRESMQNPDFEAPDKIVYVSCNPATLARDLGILCQNRVDHASSAHYQLTSTRIINMFPHTSHVESISVLQLVAVTVN